jgi:crotonobetainyl-CoA:carnitine CoA-transferase CaiB-like acyl-CoA transferase
VSKAVSGGALAGTVVIDASRVLAGPYAGQILGDHGAEVIKIETFGGDDTRAYGPPFVDDVAPYYLGLNRNKKDLALDLGSDAGREVLFQLLERADVLIENFKLSTWKKWGVNDLSALRDRFPRLIHCRISGFGDKGELGGLPGYDAALQALSGLSSINGDPDGQGTRIGIPLVDTSTGMHAAMGVLLALLERARSGKGQQVEATLFDTALAMLHPHTANVLHGGKSARTGNGHPNIVPYDLFPTATEPLFLAIGNDRQFATLCRLLGNPELSEKPEYRNNAQRVRNRNALREDLVALMANQDAQALFRTLMDHGVPCAPVLTVEQSLQQQHTLDREMKVSIGRYHGIGVPVKLDRTPGSVRLPPPGIGEHSVETLTRFGFDAERIAALRDQNIIQ